MKIPEAIIYGDTISVSPGFIDGTNMCIYMYDFD